MNSNSIIKNLVWKVTKEPLDYLEALKIMDNLVLKLINYEIPETVWILSHTNVYTKGISSNENELLNNIYQIPVINVKRGGKFTYHGPGQKIVYPILDLRNRGKDIKDYVNKLQLWIIKTLNYLNLDAYAKPNFIGIWVNNNGQEKKIAAIGVKLTKWITSYGIALNVNPDLKYFNSIIPCGITEFGVTSLSDLNIKISNQQLNNILKDFFSLVFMN